MKDTHKYRIRVITRRNGNVSYQPHVRRVFCEWLPKWVREWEWNYIWLGGDESAHGESNFSTRGGAERAIADHKSIILTRVGNEIVSKEDIYL